MAKINWKKKMAVLLKQEVQVDGNLLVSLRGQEEMLGDILDAYMAEQKGFPANFFHFVQEQFPRSRIFTFEVKNGKLVFDRDSTLKRLGVALSEEGGAYEEELSSGLLLSRRTWKCFFLKDAQYVMSSDQGEPRDIFGDGHIALSPDGTSRNPLISRITLLAEGAWTIGRQNAAVIAMASELGVLAENLQTVALILFQAGDDLQWITEALAQQLPSVVAICEEVLRVGGQEQLFSLLVTRPEGVTPEWLTFILQKGHQRGSGGSSMHTVGRYTGRNDDQIALIRYLSQLDLEQFYAVFASLKSNPNSFGENQAQQASHLVTSFSRDRRQTLYLFASVGKLPVNLRQILQRGFSLQEIETMIFDMGLSYEFSFVSGTPKSTVIGALIEKVEQNPTRYGAYLLQLVAKNDYQFGQLQLD